MSNNLTDGERFQLLYLQERVAHVRAQLVLAQAEFQRAELAVISTHGLTPSDEIFLPTGEIKRANGEAPAPPLEQHAALDE